MTGAVHVLPSVLPMHCSKSGNMKWQQPAHLPFFCASDRQTRWQNSGTTLTQDITCNAELGPADAHHQAAGQGDDMRALVTRG